jgi:hypothetical protein
VARKYSSTELANVQNYLMYKGHACPCIDGDTVHYLDRTAGFHRVVRSLKIDAVLEEIRGLKTVPVEEYTEFQSGSTRYGVGHYQVVEIGFRIMYIEDLKIALRGLFDS